MKNTVTAALETLSRVPRKGQTFRRKSDGFTFLVVRASRVCPGAHLQCVDARLIMGWYDAPALARDFVRVSS